MTLFVDTSILYAVADRTDTGNATAKAILMSGESLITSDHVLVESWRLIQRRLGHRAADDFWAGIRAGSIELSVVGSIDLEAAWVIGATYPDQGFSIVDRTSFAVMLRLGIHRAA
ncbi:MAG: PIN domain-containing protein, partial [Candidatus Limnocylindrales bacterium]